MKNKNYIKLNILSIILVLVFVFNSFADDLLEQLGPAAIEKQLATISKEDLANVISDDDFNDKMGTGRLTNANINLIRQIVLAETTTANDIVAPTAPSEYNATQVDVPTAIVAPTENFVPSPEELITSYNMNVINLNNFTVKTITNAKVQDTQAPTYALINASTKEIYATKDQNTKYNPSGLTNLMTAYIASEHLALNTVLKVNASAVKGIDKDASIAALRAGDTITLKDAIASMFIKGCVDSSNVVAESVAGSIDNFVTLMNETATSFGLTNTKFVDPSGIGENETTALDMSIIMAKVCEKPELLELLKLYQYTLPAVSKRGQLIIYSRNTQLNKENATYNANVAASRLAHTSKAKFCIASLMQQNNQNYIAVVLKSEGQQFAATKKLFEFAKTVDGIATNK